MTTTSSTPPGAAIFLGVGAGYLLLAQYVLFLNDPVYLGAGFWPAAGLTLGALLLLPTQRWPWVLAAIVAAEGGGNLAHGYPPAAALWWTAGNCIEPLVGAALIRRFGDPHGALVPVRNLLLFLVCGVLLGPLLGASVGSVGSVWVIGNPFWQVWPKYVVGDALGVLVVAPLLLSWREPASGRGSGEAMLLLISLAVVSVLAFRNWPDQWDIVLPYLTVPFLTWAALRFGIRGAALALLLTANVANFATATGYGPFSPDGVPSGHAITLLQVFLGITAATVLILAALVDDLTDRRAAEAALRASAATLRQQAELLDKARDAIIVLDMDLRVRFWSEGAERLYGWPRGDAVGQGLGALCGDAASTASATLSALLEHDEWNGPVTEQRQDGSNLTVERRWTLVRDEHGQPRSILAIHSDVTTRVALDAQLRRAQRLEAVGQLTGGIAHDFNNLLMVIVGNAELLAESLHEQPRLRTMAELISTSADRGADLVRRMLTFAGRQALAAQSVDIDDLIADMAPLLRRTLSENTVIERCRDGESWPALIDPEQFESAVLNLVLNARDAMPDGGRLRIESSTVAVAADADEQHPGVPPGEYVTVTVSDTGSGIAAQHLDKVFDPFFTTRTVGKGSGLGLSMVYGFIRQSSGHVSIVSAPGNGTSVRLYLPRAAPPERPRPAAAVPTVTATLEDGGTVLLVEDDDLVREHVQGQLADLGHRVLAARNGPEGLELLRANTDIDLLFTDLTMPGGLSGLELAEAARQLRPELPVLFTSGYSEDVLAGEARLGPQAQLLRKPYRRQELRSALRRVLGDAPAAAP